MELYKKVSEAEMRKGVKVEYVGLYTLHWGAPEPTDGFVEIENDELLQELKDRGMIIPIPPDSKKREERDERTNKRSSRKNKESSGKEEQSNEGKGAALP